MDIQNQLFVDLEGALAAYGIASTEEQRGLLLRHLALVSEKNKVINLTRIVDPHDAIIRHVVDSLLLLPSLDNLTLPDEASFVDIGTGAGFPGIPLAIMSSYQGILIDSVGKKVTAVNEFIEELGLTERLQAQAVRAEDLARTSAQSFDFVVARAVAELGVLVEYASPLLKRGGYLVVSKARISDEELSRGDATAKIVGMRRVSRETYELPGDTGHREVLVYVHDRKSSVRLPRKNGDAKHRPLV